jgi:hypothetical protein
MNDQIIVPQLIKNLSDNDVGFVLSTLLRLKGYMQESDQRESIPDREYNNHLELWKDILDESLRANCILKLNKFMVSEWFPRFPGLFHTNEAKISREEAKYNIEKDTTWNVSKHIDHAKEMFNEIYKDDDSYDDFTLIFNPHGKLSMLNGGVGCVRMTDKIVDGETVWFMSASSTNVAHEGFPIALPNILYNKLIDAIQDIGFVTCDIIGKLQFIKNELKNLYYGYVNVPQLYLFVEEINIVPMMNTENKDFVICVPITFESEYEGNSALYASYVTFFTNIPDSFQRSVDWLENIYVKGKYNGRVITDFDEMKSHFRHAIFSIDRLMTNSLNERQIKKILEEAHAYGAIHLYANTINDMQIGKVVNMTQEKAINISGSDININAPVFIADEIQNCFNTLKDAEIEPNIENLLNDLLIRIAEVSKHIPQNDAQHAKTMVRDAESLVKEASSSNPRRKWYEVSLEGLKDAANAIGEIAKPVLDVVSKLSPLLLSI